MNPTIPYRLAMRCLMAAALAMLATTTPARAQDDNLTLQLLDRVQALEDSIREIRRVLEDNLDAPARQGGVATRDQMERLLGIISDNEFRILRLEQQIQSLAGRGIGPAPGTAALAPQATATAPSGTPAPLTPQSSLNATSDGQTELNFDADGNIITNDAPAAPAAVAAILPPAATPDEQYAFAQEKAQLNDLETAAAAFTEFISLNPEHERIADAHFWLGRVQYINSDYENAVITFREFQTRWPDDPRVEQTLLWIGDSVVNFAPAETACAFLGELPALAANPDESFLARVATLRETAGCI